MAKKKTVVEPQEEQRQDAAAPVEEVVDGGSLTTAGEAGEGWEASEFGGGMADNESGPNGGAVLTGGETPPAPAEFPPSEEEPFTNAPEGDAAWGGAAPTEQVGEGGAPVLESGEDYNALLSEVGSALPIDTTHLVLAEAGDAASNDGAENVPQSPTSEDAVHDTGEFPQAVSERGPVQSSSPRTGPRTVFNQRSSQVLTINAHERIETEEERQEVIWHEIRNAYRTRRILTGTLDGLEQTPSGRTLAVVDYRGFRVAIPLKEMLFLPKQLPKGTDHVAFMDRQRRNLANMLGAEIDFVVKGIDSNTHSIVASRKDAMLRKRQTFYMNTDELGSHMIYEGRVVQARVIAVAEKVVRVEAFGVECAIIARDLSWEWLGDAREHFFVGDRVLIRVQTIDRPNTEELSITADIRSVSATTNLDNVKKCQLQCRYVGRVTDVRSGVVYIRLNNGVNAIAHACYDMRTPGKKDDVSFAVTKLDEEKGVAVGIITRIIKQNL